MDDVQEHGEIPTPTAEELKQEDEVLQETPAEKVRSSIVEKYALEDNDDNKAFIDQLTADTLEQRKAFGKAISQKRKYRESALKAKPATEQPKPAAQQQHQQPDVDAIVNQKLEERDLESMDIPDDIKTEVKKLAKTLGVSVRQAARDPYIQFKLDEHKREKKTEDAAPRTTARGASVKFDVNKPPQVDMSTEAGRKTWDEYTQFLAQQQGQ